MALATTIEGDGTLISLNKSRRSWGVKQSDDTFKYFYEEQTEEVREWVALTEAIAETTATAASQAGLSGDEYASYAATLDNLTVGSYKLTKTITESISQEST